jgi:hypothetical protein
MTVPLPELSERTVWPALKLRATTLMLTSAG